MGGEVMGRVTFEEVVANRKRISALETQLAERDKKQVLRDVIDGLHLKHLHERIAELKTKLAEARANLKDEPRERWLQMEAPARYLFVKWLLGNGLEVDAGSAAWSWSVTAEDSDEQYNPGDK